MVRLQFVALVLLLGSAPPMLAQATTDDDDPQQRLRTVLNQSVEWFEFRQAGQAEPLEAKTVLRWTNNARESVDGLTVIWINAIGRPEAVAAVYPYGDLFCLEFDSLSRTSFEATMKGQPFWAPESAGLSFALFNDAPPPPSSAGARLLQMKALARKFEVAMLGWNPNANQHEELRLLPRPVHRYRLTSSEVILDGGLFAFTSGTDPEALLVLEAVKQEDGYAWQYAFVRRTSGALAARLGDQVVWQVKAYPDGTRKENNFRGYRQPLAPLLDAVE